MKKSLLLAVGLFPLLMSCGNQNAQNAANGKGIIDCNSIELKQNGSTIFSKEYSFSPDGVFEYKNSDGEFIYTNNFVLDNENSDFTNNDIRWKSLRVYKDKYVIDPEDKVEEYKFNKFVGYVSIENNYYLNLDAKMVDCETKWGEWKASGENKASSTTSSDSSSTPSPYEKVLANPDNKKAYECLKTNFYPTLSHSSSNDEMMIVLDLAKKGGEYHSYFKYGDDVVASYEAKWF